MLAFGVQSSPVPCNVVSFKNDDGVETCLMLEYAVAGYDKKNISVYVDPDSNTLNISADKQDEKTDDPEVEKRQKNFSYVVRGIKKSNWKVSYKIGYHVDKDNIGSWMQDGILYVKVPYKTEAATKQAIRQIPIE